MANEKIFNTRLQLKYDTYAAWTSANPVLKAGELAIATVPAGTSGTGMTNLPNLVIKCGDGTSHYNDLKFVSALAADVHEWAKAANKPAYGYGEIEGLEAYVRGLTHEEIQDTDTKYTIEAVAGETYKYELKSKGLGDAGWTKVADLDLSEVNTRLNALEGLVGTTKVADQITGAIGTLNADEVKAGQGEIIEAVSESAGVVAVTKRKLVAADIPVIEQNQVNGLAGALENAAKAGTDAAAAAETNAKAYALEQLNERVGSLDYNDPNYTAGQFVTKVTEVDGVIAVERAEITMDNVKDLNATIQGINDEIDTKQDALTFTPVNGVATPNATDNRVATEKFVLDSVANLNGAMHFEGTRDAVPEGDENGYFEPGDVVLVGVEEYVFDGAAWHCLGNESIYQTKEQANEQHEVLQKAIDDGLEALGNAKQDNLTFVGTHSADNGVMTKSATQEMVNGAVGALDAAKVTVGAGEIIESIEEIDGIVYVTKRALAKADIPVIDQAQVDGLAAALENAAKVGTDAAAAAEEAAKAHADAEIENAIGALDYADAAVEKQVVTAVSETDGIIAVTRAPLADVAWSGHVKDLVQDDYVIVFNCGTATTVI